MSSEISWPAKPFYIQSKTGLSNMALTIAGGVVVMQPFTPTFEQLWTSPDPRGAAFLKHLSTGRLLARGSDGQPIA